MTDDSKKKYKLTVFLIKESYSNIEDFISIEGFRRIDVAGKGERSGSLIYKGGFQSKPAWVSLFQELPGFDASRIMNQSSKALYVLKCENRWFCFTFGYARHLIDEHAYERNFGLMVTLNLSDPEAIKSIDKTNIGHISLHSKEQATRDIELSGFEFNTDVDLLKSISGKSGLDDKGERETISGRDSLSIYTRATVEDFYDIAKRLFEAFSDTKYKELYPWINKINEERDVEVIEQLNQELCLRIVNQEFDYIWIAIPEVVIWEDIEGFSFRAIKDNSKKHGSVLYQDLDMREWVSQINVPTNLNDKKLKSRKIYVKWQDGRPPTSWSVYRCLNAEVDLSGRTYILNDGSWYNIDVGFVTETDDFFSSVPDASFSLPNYGVDTEPDYLKKVHEGDADYALMDRKVIMVGGGKSKVEFCDLLSINNDIIHVKKYGGSSLLSHLFFQALVSGECFLFEESFREELNSYLPASHKLSDTKLQPIASEYNVCIAIMSKVPGDLKLPFFSRVSFKHTVRALQNFGYNVFKLKIDI